MALDDAGRDFHKAVSDDVIKLLAASDMPEDMRIVLGSLIGTVITDINRLARAAELIVDELGAANERERPK